MQVLDRRQSEDFKRSTAQQWDLAAAGWDRHTPQIRAWLRTATDAMLGMAGVGRGMAVLDLAAGAGDQTLDVAARVGSAGAVTAVDLSAGILALAEESARRGGHANVRALVADAEDLPLEDACFDAAVCRLGLMFLPDPGQGLRELHRVLKPGAGVCVMVFSRPEKNPCITTLMATALRHAGAPPRDPYQPGALLSLGKPDLLDDLFRRAGFRDVATTTLDAPFRLPTTADYLAFVKSSASPVQQILGRLDAPAAAAAWDDIAARLQVFETPDGWEGPNELLLAAGRR
jgi:ubiquinone/menaquinone biosynthesis C-methylase UbiE